MRERYLRDPGHVTPEAEFRPVTLRDHFINQPASAQRAKLKRAKTALLASVSAVILMNILVVVVPALSDVLSGSRILVVLEVILLAGLLWTLVRYAQQEFITRRLVKSLYVGYVNLLIGHFNYRYNLSLTPKNFDSEGVCRVEVLHLGRHPMKLKSREPISFGWFPTMCYWGDRGPSEARLRHDHDPRREARFPTTTPWDVFEGKKS